jgi:hypothetical protein
MFNCTDRESVDLPFDDLTPEEIEEFEIDLEEDDEDEELDDDGAREDDIYYRDETGVED